jgi:hypothetical protein
MPYKDRLMRNAYGRARYAHRRKEESERKKRYRIEHPERMREVNNRANARFKTNHYELYMERRRGYAQEYRSTINGKVRSNLTRKINYALHGKMKSESTVKLTECSMEFLRGYLESRFLPGMSWENYGKFGWHIDHIKPCCSFDMSDPKQQRECFHYKNLQPLWAIDNHRKWGKF